jgi:hypothetical protein
MHRLLSLFQHLLRLLLLVCCCWLLTGPQLLLQLSAWSWMIASYSQESNIKQAFTETFGGERPCELCKFITAIDAEQETAPVNEPTEVKPLKLLPGKTEHLTMAPTYLIASKHSDNNRFGRYRHPDVPTPPPRNV